MSNLRKCGRPRKTTTRENRLICREVKSNSATSSRQIKESLSLDVSSRTIRRRLNEEGIHSYFAKKKPLISERNRRKRLAFAKKHITKPSSFWDTVVWTDESKFELVSNKRRKRVWYKSSERLKKQNIQSTVKFGGGSCMTWGCFSAKGVGNLVKIEGRVTGASYVNILQNNLSDSVSKMSLEAFVFQQDNDPKHTSRIAQQYFTENNIDKMEWPPQSPDLNPIENLWSILDDKVPIERRTNMETFWIALTEVWSNIPISTLENLVKSIPRRLRDVIDNKGGATKY